MVGSRGNWSARFGLNQRNRWQAFVHPKIGREGERERTGLGKNTGLGKMPDKKRGNGGNTKGRGKDPKCYVNRDPEIQEREKNEKIREDNRQQGVPWGPKTGALKPKPIRLKGRRKNPRGGWTGEV